MKELFADIAVELPLDKTFCYSVPEGLKTRAAAGMRVLVGFGKRTVTGYIVGLSDVKPPGVRDVKPIIDVLDTAPVFDAKRLKFFRWLSEYYFSPIGEALSLISPGSASVSSRRRLFLAPGASFPDKKGLDLEILKAAEKGVFISTIVKRLRGKPVYSTVERLKDEGLIEEETLLSGGKQKTVEVFSVEDPADRDPELKRSPVQAKVYKFLLENDDASMEEIRKGLGNVADAVRKLREKGLVRSSEKEALRSPLGSIEPKEMAHAPNPEQAAAIDTIVSSIKKGGFSPFLLYGVTGSGKTLVYVRILDEAVKSGKKAIILAPEIALTPWPAAYLKWKFPGRVALWHSGLSEGERYDEWARVLRGDVDIVVGARSALFAPLKDLGLIIVDEEHETSYKQEDGVRYNARDSALMLGQTLGITVVLGSATPSVETFHNSKTGRITPLSLTKRVEDRKLPHIEVLDMKGDKAVISGRLTEALSDALGSGEQALLFLNRRGFSSIICRDCGHQFACLNCSVSLTMHRGEGVLKCHYCDLSMEIPAACPECEGYNLVAPGTGTEKVEEEVRRLFPKARIGRMDRDTTRRKGAAKKIIDAVEEREVDILIGTQMVSKGHHFPGISLVGVISGDTSLNIPDFRSSERTFQLITQAAGRGGRGDTEGNVVIQTLNPTHYSFHAALTHDYEGFFREEIDLRKEAGYPPFLRLCNMKLEGLKEAEVVKASEGLKKTALRLLKDRQDIAVLGPAPALLARVKNRFRFQMLIKGRDTKSLHAFVKALRDRFVEMNKNRVTLTIDMDPATIA